MLVEVIKSYMKDFWKFLEIVKYKSVKVFDYGRYVNFYIKYI